MQPNFSVLKNVLLNNNKIKRIPFYEHLIDDEIIEKIMDYEMPSLNEKPNDYCEKLINFYFEMGYDYVPFEVRPNFPDRISPESTSSAATNHDWVDEHGGPLKNWPDYNNLEWPEENPIDYNLFEIMGRKLPEGMKIIGGTAGGIFEHTTFLMGFTNFAEKIYTDPKLVYNIIDDIGKTLVNIAKNLSKKPYIGAYRMGDDLGFNTSTLVSPMFLKKHIFPWYKELTSIAHSNDKPFVLHSCGNLESVMDYLIHEVEIDAKHSFEDKITPVTEAQRRWGKDLAILGGIDVDFLCRASPKEIKNKTKTILAKCSKNGGYALGTGNSVPKYMPAKNYLAMLEAGNEFNDKF